MLRPKQHTHLLGQIRRPACLFVYVAVLFLLFFPTPTAAQPTGYQEYYVLGYEEHIWRAFLGIYDGSDSDIPGLICSTVSLVATANYQVVYYDHWEDGYEANLLHPVQSSTQVYTLTVGASLSLTSTQDSGATINQCVPVAPGRDAADIRYDGGDRILSSGGPVDLMHAMWPLRYWNGSAWVGGAWVGGAWEIYSQQVYAEDHSYRLPIGEDLYKFDADAYGDFRNVYLQLAAFEDNTTVSIDNGAGDIVNLTLDQGQTYFSMGYINSTPVPTITINSGTTIRSNKPTQVGLITGAASATQEFQGRFLIMLPNQQWGADYVLPIPSGYSPYAHRDVSSEIYIFNPNDFAITLNAYDRETQSTFTISPTAHVSSRVAYSGTIRGALPQDSAVRFTSPDGVFGVVVCADTSATDYDWGFSGVPVKYLTQDYYASWAPGTTNLSDNTSPVWVTPAADGATFYVDFGPLDGVVDETFTLDVLQQQRIFDPDNDNTGMHVWATDKFAIVWGEDPRVARRGTIYLDMGVAMLPLQQRWLDPILTLDKAAEPTILPPTGGVVTFTLVTQAYDAPLVNVDITDTLPSSWTYVPNSTHVTYPDGSTANPEPTRDDQTLFWNLSADLEINESLILTFQAQLTTAGAVGTTAYDGFESGGYSGGENWTGHDWHEIGDDGHPDSGEVAITNTLPFFGSYSLHVRGSNNSISRTADLSSFTSPVLRFMRQVDSLEGPEYFNLDVYDGIHWTTVLTWSDGSQEGSYVQEMVDLVPYAGAATAIRFRSGDSVSAWDHLYVDQVEVYDAVVANVNRSEAVGKYEYSDTLFNPSDEATIYISPLNLIKSVSSAQATIGDTLVYTFSYANASSSTTLTNIVLRDVVPVQHVTFQSASDGGVYDGASGAITWTLGTLAPGASGTVTFNVTVNDFVENGTVIENVGYINGDQTVEGGSNVVHTNVLAPDLKFNKAGPTVAARDQVFTYTLSYENAGGTEATGVVIWDTIPPNTTYVPGSLAIITGTEWTALSDAGDADQGAYISPTLIITPGVTAGTIAAGEAGQIRFSVQIEDELPLGSLVQNWATLDRNLDIPREFNMVVTRISDLLINKAAEQAEVAAGDVISYTLMYENVSTTIPQTEVYVREPIPGGTSLVSGTVYGSDQVEYSWDNGATWSATLPITPVTHIRWYDAEVPTSTQATAGFTVQVNAALPEGTIIQNIAHISSTETAEHFREWIPSNQVKVTTRPPNLGTIYGTVFRDTDGDGVRDVGELGIPDVFVTLDEAITITTGLDGNYTFTTKVAGTHTVVETDPTVSPFTTSDSVPSTSGKTDLPGYFSTTPNEVHVDVTLGNSYRVDFGDMLTNAGFATIYGTVFNDADGNGRWDTGELGIAGVLVTLDETITVTTDLNGNYTFSTTVAGIHTVVKTDPDGYSPTTLNKVHVDVTLGYGYQVDFGNAVVGMQACGADSYEEDDTASQAKVLVVGTSQAHQFCDDATDWVKFSAKANAVYTITTSSWGQRADTFLALFDTDGHTLLAANDNYTGATDHSSRITWQTPGSGVYYVRTTNQDGLTGCHTYYSLLIEDQEQRHMYLPIIMRNQEQRHVYLPLMMRSYRSGGE